MAVLPKKTAANFNTQNRSIKTDPTCWSTLSHRLSHNRLTTAVGRSGEWFGTRRVHALAGEGEAPAAQAERCDRSSFFLFCDRVVKVWAKRSNKTGKVVKTQVLCHSDSFASRVVFLGADMRRLKCSYSLYTVLDLNHNLCN